MKLVLINPKARQILKRAGLQEEISRYLDGKAHVLVPRVAQPAKGDEQRAVREAVFHALDAHVEKHETTEVFVVGGDHTFTLVLNWAKRLEDNRRPAIMSVGGGEMCYMARQFRLPHRKPLKNLKLIFENPDRVKQGEWAPLEVRDWATDHKEYVAVFGNGLISRFVSWYDDVGKGSVLKVAFMIIIAAVSVFIPPIRRWHGRISGTIGSVFLDEFEVPDLRYMAVVAAAIPTLIPTCKPFQGEPEEDEFFCMAYWGSWWRLALGIPFIWFGYMPFWVRRYMYNAQTKSVTIDSPDNEVVYDGDLILGDLIHGAKSQPVYGATIRRAEKMKVLIYEP